MGGVIKRFDVYLVALDPTIGHEIQKTRPCLVVPPDEINRLIGTVNRGADDQGATELSDAGRASNPFDQSFQKLRPTSLPASQQRKIVVNNHTNIV